MNWRRKYQRRRRRHHFASSFSIPNNSELRPLFFDFNQCSFDIFHNSPWRLRIALANFKHNECQEIALRRKHSQQACFECFTMVAAIALFERARRQVAKMLQNA